MNQNHFFDGEFGLSISQAGRQVYQKMSHIKDESGFSEDCPISDAAASVTSGASASAESIQTGEPQTALRRRRGRPRLEGAKKTNARQDYMFDF
jgi:hypothetical protein